MSESAGRRYQTCLSRPCALQDDMVCAAETHVISGACGNDGHIDQNVLARALMTGWGALRHGVQQAWDGRAPAGIACTPDARISSGACHLNTSDADAVEVCPHFCPQTCPRLRQDLPTSATWPWTCSGRQAFVLQSLPPERRHRRAVQRLRKCTPPHRFRMVAIAACGGDGVPAHDAAPWDGRHDVVVPRQHVAIAPLQCHVPLCALTSAVMALRCAATFDR